MDILVYTKMSIKRIWHCIIHLIEIFLFVECFVRDIHTVLYLSAQNGDRLKSKILSFQWSWSIFSSKTVQDLHGSADI